MKKIILLVIVSILLCVISMLTYKVNLPNADEIKVYSQSSDLDIDAVAKTRAFGVTRYTLSNRDIEKIQEDFSNIISIEFTYKKISIDEIIEQLNCIIVSYEKVENVLIYYLYTSSIDESIEVDNRYINVEVAISKENVKIGIPLLVGEY